MNAPLSPIAAGFVAAGLEHQVGISGFGTLLRLARLNHLSRSDFPAAFGVRCEIRDDPSWVFATSEKRMSALAIATGRELAALPEWRVAPWMPFESNGMWDVLPWTLRACPVCLGYCYHTMLFQMPWVRHCPWHGAELISACRRCGRSLLSGIHQRGAMLRCACGIDHVSEVATLKRGDARFESERAAFIAAYLQWAAEAKGQTVVVAPETAEERGAEALASLVAAPHALSRWRQAFSQPVCHVDEIRADQKFHPLLASEQLELMRSLRSLWPINERLIEMPRRELHPMRRITASIVAALADAELSADELVLRLRLPSTATSRPSRSDQIFLPLRNFPPLCLDSEILQRAALRSIVKTLDSMLPGQSLETRHRGNDYVIQRVLRKLLSRCYVDGLVHALGRYLPEIYAHPRMRAAPRVPWTLVERDGLRVRRVRIAWCQRRSWEVD